VDFSSLPLGVPLFATTPLFATLPYRVGPHRPSRTLLPVVICALRILTWVLRRGFIDLRVPDPCVPRSFRQGWWVEKRRFRVRRVRWGWTHASFNRGARVASVFQFRGTLGSLIFVPACSCHADRRLRTRRDTDISPPPRSALPRLPNLQLSGINTWGGSSGPVALRTETNFDRFSSDPRSNPTSRMPGPLIEQKIQRRSTGSSTTRPLQMVPSKAVDCEEQVAA